MSYISAVIEQPEAVIPVRSLHEAMDWSLVLASQGLQVTIQGDEQSQGWQLVVPGDDYTAALQAIRKFRVENRPRSWPQPLAIAGMIFDWRALAWFIILVILFVLSQSQVPALVPAGIMDTALVRSGQWWRLFTAVTLHADVAHLAGNVTTGILLLGLAMGSFGFGWSVLAAFLAGAGGNVADWMLYQEAHQSLGASGMVMGALGLLTVESCVALATPEGRRSLAVRGVFGGILLLVLLGLDPNTNVIAHIGGFVAGGLLGLALQSLPNEILRRPSLNRLAELLCASLMVFTWWLALR